MHKFIAALALTSLLTAPAFAEVKTTFERGYWSLIEGTANDDAQVCVAGTGGNVARTDTYWGFDLKRFSSSDMLQVWFVDNLWDIPDGTVTEIKVSFDNADPWVFEVQKHPDYADTLTGQLSEASQDTFYEEFMKARTATVIFKGTAEPWKLDMTGSTAVALKFIECVNALDAVKAHPQPFDSKPQPFEAPAVSKPTVPQPFTPV